MWILRIADNKCTPQAIAILTQEVTVVPVCTLNQHNVSLRIGTQQCTCNVPSGSEH
jgi:hypothetical protein